MKTVSRLRDFFFRVELALEVLCRGDFWVSDCKKMVSEELESKEYEMAWMRYERDVARIDLSNMNRWKDRALAAERKVERNRAILKQRGPRPLRLP